MIRPAGYFLALLQDSLNSANRYCRIRDPLRMSPNFSRGARLGHYENLTRCRWAGCNWARRLTHVTRNHEFCRFLK